MCENDEFVGRVLNRREVVAMLGATGAWLLMACRSDDDSQAFPTAASQAATSISIPTATATTTTETTTVAPEASATGSPAGPTQAETMPESTAASEGASETATMEVLPACVVSPELTEGPYFVDENLNRSDIRTDPSTGGAFDGAPLELALRVLQVGGEDCLPLEGAQVDIWQCDALGVYSDISDPGFSTVGQQFLRGFQVTDSDGVARFTTIYPGWYQGRTVHIHFKVRSSASTDTSYEFTSQLFFDDELSDRVFQQEPYAGKGDRGTRNDNDGIYQESGNQLLLNVEETGSGYAATFDIGMIV